jgi:hypothetical protein
VLHFKAGIRGILEAHDEEEAQAEDIEGHSRMGIIA